MKRLVFSAAVLALAGCAAAAQIPPQSTAVSRPPAAHRGPDLAAQRAAMDRLSFMLGEWRGEATVVFPTQRRVFQTERIERDLEGLLLVIHGNGYADATRSGEPIFRALGVISYDDSRGIYEFRVYNDGRAATAEARFLDDGRLQWTMNFAPVHIRYTITSADGRWNEVGEMSRDDGATWSPTIEMNLVRVAP